MNTIIEADSFDVMRNLAVEEALCEAHQDGACLFLWRNDNTVVIGRNQNAWRECRTKLLEDEGGQLARRKSGGGAVYHDLGNLNFSFIVNKKDYDVARQNAVLVRAVGAFGLGAAQTGRNDVVLADTGEKFSGCAFRLGEQVCLHHGTVLIGADMEKLSRYLAPSPEKLQAKGVASVRARVTNLKAHEPSITAEGMASALRKAFIEEYGPARERKPSALDGDKVTALQQHYASWEWRFGHTPVFDIVLDRRFDWGGAELMLRIENGCIAEVKLYTDSMEESLSTTVEQALLGAPYTGIDMQKRLMPLVSAQAGDLGCWISQRVP